MISSQKRRKLVVDFSRRQFAIAIFVEESQQLVGLDQGLAPFLYLEKLVRRLQYSFA